MTACALYLTIKRTVHIAWLTTVNCHLFRQVHDFMVEWWLCVVKYDLSELILWSYQEIFH